MAIRWRRFSNTVLKWTFFNRPSRIHQAVRDGGVIVSGSACLDLPSPVRVCYIIYGRAGRRALRPIPTVAALPSPVHGHSGYVPR